MLSEFDVTWKAGKAEVMDILRSRAQNEGVISYSELSQQLRSIVLPHDGPAMVKMLDDVSIEEFRAGRGMLSAVVVHKTGDQMPGAGFFKTAKDLGNIVDDKLAFWSAELTRVHNQWSAGAAVLPTGK